jgi:hypothetical protein
MRFRWSISANTGEYPIIFARIEKKLQELIETSHMSPTIIFIDVRHLWDLGFVKSKNLA